METARWIAAAAFGAFSLFCIVGNPIAAWLACREGRNYSWVPVVGAVFGILAIAACPTVVLSRSMLLPVVRDLTLPMFVFVLLTGSLWSEPTNPGLQTDEPSERRCNPFPWMNLMSPWPDEKISTLALRYIRKSSMDSGQWLYTRLGEWDSRVTYGFHSAELPLVATYISPTSWSVFTARRVAGSLDGENFDISPLDVAQDHWGSDPKGVSGDPTGIATLRLRNGRSFRFDFETGKAWMGPTYAMQFWRIKYPVLDNLVV